MNKTSQEYIKAMKKEGFFGDRFGLEEICAELKALANMTEGQDIYIIFHKLYKQLDKALDEMEHKTVEDFNKHLNQFYEETGIKYEMIYLGTDKGSLFAKDYAEDEDA